MNLTFDDVGVLPDVVGKDGPLYSKEKLDLGILRMINTECFFYRRVGNMTSDLDDAIEKTAKITNQFSTAIDKFMETEKRFKESSKVVAGSVRDSSERLSQGLARIEKAANFDRLDRYVHLLERAAKALDVLAELEASGKLEKISVALK